MTTVAAVASVLTSGGRCVCQMQQAGCDDLSHRCVAQARPATWSANQSRFPVVFSDSQETCDLMRQALTNVAKSALDTKSLAGTPSVHIRFRHFTISSNSISNTSTAWGPTFEGSRCSP